MNLIACWLSSSADETIQFGRRLAARLETGDVVALVGPLGVGKTQLTKGLAVGLGVSDDRLVTSPTFVLVNEYAGRVPVFHLDAYRLSGEQEFAALGVEEMQSVGVVVVEWADKVAAALSGEVLWIDLSIAGDTRRQLVLRTSSAALAARLENLAGAE